MNKNQDYSALLAVALALVDQYAVMVVAALLGGLLVVGAASTTTRWQAVRLLVLLMGVSVVFTGFLAWLAETRLGMPAAKTTAPIAFLVAWLGDRLPIIKERLLDRVVGRLEKRLDEV